MKKILILANSSGGLYDFRNELVRTLLNKYEVYASLPDEVRTGALADEGVHVIHTDINRRGINPVEDLKLYREYSKLLKKIKPDLVLTYTIKPNIYGGYCCRKHRIPYITTITGLGSTFQKEGLLKKLIVTMYRMSLKGAGYIFFQNSENMRIFDEYGIKGKGKVLVNGSGVDLQRHVFEDYPSEISGNNERFIKLLYIGRTMKEKGTDELLSAAEHFKGKGIEFGFLGYPDEDYQDKLNEYENKGYIKQYGFDPEVHGYIKNCHAVVLPSYHEGMSNVLQEAAAIGRPVLASDIPGCREIFDDGVTGIGFKSADTDDLIRAVERFLSLSEDKHAAMGRAGRDKMEKEFDRRVVASSYMEKIDEMTGLI